MPLINCTTFCTTCFDDTETTTQKIVQYSFEQIDASETEKSKHAQDKRLTQVDNTRTLTQAGTLEDDIRLVSPERRQSLSCIKSSFHDSSSEQDGVTAP